MDLSSVAQSLTHTEGDDESTSSLLQQIAGLIHANAEDPYALHELADSIVAQGDNLIAATHEVWEPPEEPEVSEEDVEEETSEYAGHTVDELKEFLAERELPVSGTKTELIARLEESDAEESEGGE
jgi:hypothetical protein